ncbi:MAG: hypothetical protein ACYDAG_08730 [Chloroflexota bacterium]
MATSSAGRMLEMYRELIEPSEKKGGGSIRFGETELPRRNHREENQTMKIKHVLYGGTAAGALAGAYLLGSVTLSGALAKTTPAGQITHQTASGAQVGQQGNYQTGLQGTGPDTEQASKTAETGGAPEAPEAPGTGG